MRRQFLVNILFLISLNVLIKPFWILGIDRTIQNTVGSEEYGIYFALFGFSFLLNTLLDFGITNYNTWSISRNPSFLKIGYKKLAVFKVLFGGIYLIGTLSLGLVSGYNGVEFQLLLGLSISQFLLSFILFQRSILAGLQLFWLDSIFSVLDKLLLILLCSYLLWFNGNTRFQIEWLVLAQIGCYGFVLVMLLVITQTKRSALIISEPAEPINISVILKQSYPFALIILFMTFYYRIDAFMIERLLENSAEKAGYYAQSFRLFDVANNFVFLFTGLLFPMLSKAISKNENTNATVNMVAKILLIPAILFIPLSFGYGEQLLNKLYTDVSPNSLQVLILLSIAFVGLALTAVFGTVLTAAGRLNEMMRITFVGFVLNLLLNLVLIPNYEIAGAAAASGLIQVGTGIFMLLKCSKLQLINFPNAWLLKYCLSIILSLVLVYFLKDSLETTFELVIIILIQGCLIFGLRLFDLKQFTLSRFIKK